MPEFELEGERSRDRRPDLGGDQRPDLGWDEEDLTGGVRFVGGEELDDDEGEHEPDRVQRVLGRESFVPSMRLPGFIRRRLPDLPPEVKYRLSVVAGLGQIVALVVAVTLAIIIGGKLLFGITFTEPGTGREVLERVDDPEDLSWSVETVRKKKIDGVDLRQDTVRGHAVNLRSGAFQAQVNGLTDGQFRMVGDGRRALLIQSAQTRRLTRYPAKEALRPLMPSDVAEGAQEILDKRFTAYAQRAWLVRWKPRRADLLQLLGADLFKLSGKDFADLRAGRYRLINASAVVLRRDKRLYELHVQLEVNGAQLEILSIYRQQNTGTLSDLELEE